MRRLESQSDDDITAVVSESEEEMDQKVRQNGICRYSERENNGTNCKNNVCT